LSIKGLVDIQEKIAIKELLLSKDARFAHEFDQAQETGNWER
jgi:hypothetical protein